MLNKYIYHIILLLLIVFVCSITVISYKESLKTMINRNFEQPRSYSFPFSLSQEYYDRTQLPPGDLRDIHDREKMISLLLSG